MIANDKRRNEAGLDVLVRDSIGAFMRERGAELTDPASTVPDNRVMVSFDSEGLRAPVAGLFEPTDVPVRVANTLLVSEPGLIDVRMKMPESLGPPLRFLEESIASGSARSMSAAELLALDPPHRPVDELRHYLAMTSADCRANGFPVGRGFHEDVENVAASLIHYTIARYYPQIDRGTPVDVAEVCELFAPDGEYNRAGKVLSGLDAIRTFYTAERTLSGTHTVEAIAVKGLSALVTGVFKGVSIGANEPRVLEFADRWRFNTDGFVTHRHTYLSQGHAAAQ